MSNSIELARPHQEGDPLPTGALILAQLFAEAAIKTGDKTLMEEILSLYQDPAYFPILDDIDTATPKEIKYIQTLGNFTAKLQTALDELTSKP